MEQLEKEDIQGLLIRGYGNLHASCFLMLQFPDKQKAKKYLKTVSEKITTAEYAPDDVAFHFAFTNHGLKTIGLSKNSFESFSRQFKEGMTDEHRQEILGDYEANAPSNWEWGTSAHPRIDAMLLIYAKDVNALESICSEERALLAEQEIVEILCLATNELKNGKEHFGFQDGISQPFIEGLSKSTNQLPQNIIKAGEFILGYRNMYDQYTESPDVICTDDPLEILPEKPQTPAMKDLGRNGSYLVLRQMSQDVFAFWKYLKENSREPTSTDSPLPAICLGAKMMGRWPGGAPLTLSPDSDNPELRHENKFDYFQEDKEGLKCPFGAHIRRANPRDFLQTEQSSALPKENKFTQIQSTEMVQKHRLLRRGRTYGEPVATSMDVNEIMNAKPDGKERGIHFMCFAGDLVRQFEFVQNSWVKFHKFGGLYEDSDPVIGTNRNVGDTITNSFTVQAEPIRRRYKNLPQFTRVRGGAYFFFPGIRAMKFLST
ncbi:MAG: Dyp-type peroxidase [Chitinophagales bacterium]